MKTKAFFKCQWHDYFTFVCCIILVLINLGKGYIEGAIGWGVSGLVWATIIYVVRKKHGRK